MTYQLPVVQGETEGFHSLPWAFSQVLGNLFCEPTKISEPKKGAWYHHWNFQQKIGYMLVLPLDCMSRLVRAFARARLSA